MLRHQPEEQSAQQERTLPLAQTEQTATPVVLSDEEVERLTSHFKKYSQIIISEGSLPALIGGALVFSYIFLVHPSLRNLLFGNPIRFFMLVLLMTAGIIFLSNCTPLRIRKIIAKRHENATRPCEILAIVGAGDPRFIEPLMNTWLGSGSISLAYEIVPALTQLLDRVDASTAHLISKKTLKRLLQTFRRADLHSKETIHRDYSINYVIALMQMLTRIGAIEAIPSIRSLTKLRGKESDLEEVRMVARECLEILERQATGTLLRPVEENRLPTDELLRPVEASAEKSPETLLRPASEQDTI